MLLGFCAMKVMTNKAQTNKLTPKSKDKLGVFASWRENYTLKAEPGGAN
jgi:hypothetical protein